VPGQPASAAQLRILIYAMHHAPELIGGGKISGEVANYLLDQGHDVDVVTATPFYPRWRVHEGFGKGYSLRRQGRELVARCPIWLGTNMRGIWRLIAPLSFALLSLQVVVFLILRRRPGVVIVVEPTLFCAPAALAAARLIGARTVLHVQDFELDAAFDLGFLRGARLRAIGDWLERGLRKGFDAVITISHRMAERLIDKGVDRARISIVRNWVDLDRIRPLAGPNCFRAQLGLTDDCFVILYAGVITRKTALHIVMEAAIRLAPHADIRFVVAGDGPHAEPLQARFGNLTNVSFLPLQPEPLLCELLNLADLHVLPQEPAAADLMLPSKLGGMLASGKRLVVMADPGTELHDVLEGTAILVPPGDPAALAKAILSEARAGSMHASGPMLRLATLFSREHNLPAFRAAAIGVHRPVAAA
jgi:colanic acid biosynthesis glycosyl transferase WcaI